MGPLGRRRVCNACAREMGRGLMYLTERWGGEEANWHFVFATQTPIRIFPPGSSRIRTYPLLLFSVFPQFPCYDPNRSPLEEQSGGGQPSKYGEAAAAVPARVPPPLHRSVVALGTLNVPHLQGAMPQRLRELTLHYS